MVKSLTSALTTSAASVREDTFDRSADLATFRRVAAGKVRVIVNMQLIAVANLGASQGDIAPAFIDSVNDEKKNPRWTAQDVAAFNRDQLRPVNRAFGQNDVIRMWILASGVGAFSGTIYIEYQDFLISGRGLIPTE